MQRLASAVALVISLGAAACSDEPPACWEPTHFTSADICALLGDACLPASGALPALSPAVEMAPGNLPPAVTSLQSHNNLDIVWHGDRLFFAFRTAPSHFASDAVLMYVVSTQDQVTWNLETKIELGTDVREPRFLSLGDHLFLYFAKLGQNPAAFEPQGTMVTELEQGCGWSKPAPATLDPSFIPWRFHTVDGVGYLIGYSGGENIYEPGGEPIHVQWLETTDGRDFTPVVPGQPVVLEGGSSETDFAFRPDGGVVAVSRNEAGDATGFGSKICKAEPGALGTWTCAHDPRKYDSPLFFRHGSSYWLIARRQIDNDGNYDLGRRDLSMVDQYTMYQQVYWASPKRCSLWRVDPDQLTVTWVLDLPSNGDTCFASALPLQGDQLLVYNYTSPLDDPNLTWAGGQFGPTSIYRTTLTLPP